MLQTLNYAFMDEEEKKVYDTLYEAAIKMVPSMKLFDGEEPYFELKMNKRTTQNAEKIKFILDMYGFEVADEYECEGSDYPSYCIWFKEKER